MFRQADIREGGDEVGWEWGVARIRMVRGFYMKSEEFQHVLGSDEGKRTS